MTPASLPEDTPWDLLTLYIAGEATPLHTEQVERWIASDSAHPALVAELRTLWREAPKLRRAWNPEVALEKVKRRPSGPMRVIHLPKFYRAQPISIARRVAQVSMAAAAAVAIIAVGLRFSPPAPKPPAPVFEFSTTLGQRASLRLTDGSHVTLGPVSSLRYSATPNGARTVHLVGQALFTVTHDSARPFVVHTAHGVATDLGTQFVVRNYPGDSAVVVVVIDGEVALASSAPAADSIRLRRGDRGQATSTGKLVLQHNVDMDRYLAWSEGRLEFRYTRMRDVVAELGRWYDLDIRLANKTIAEGRLSASFRDESIAEVLRLIRESLDVRVERVGRVVTIKSR